MSNRMEVDLLYLPSLSPALLAGKTCIGEKVPAWTDSEKLDYLRRIITRGHESILEHVVYCFWVKNVTRALLQELARHRHISLSVQSTRWAMHKNALHFRLPDGLGPNKEIMERAIREMLDSIQAAELPNDVAKYLLPECVLTNLVMTVNLRELRHIYKLRSGPPALKEFQELMDAIEAELPEEHSDLLVM